MKRFDVSEEIIDLFDEVAVCNKCKDQCISSIFRAKRAIWYGKQAEKAGRKAWKLIVSLHPELSGKGASYSYDNCDVFVMDDNSAQCSNKGK